MVTDIELCAECDEPTGKSGRSEDSIYIFYSDGTEAGPLCDSCADKRSICEQCGEGVYPEWVTWDGLHEGCGGEVG